MLSWSGRTVLVTGGAGFIGSHLARKLLDLGCIVSVADNFSRGTKKNIEPFIDRIRLYPLDLTEPDNCMTCSKDAEYVFHLAASVGGIQYIKKENVEGLTPSVLMNSNMLEAARKNDVKGFLFTSSACVYAEKAESLNRFNEEDAYPAKPATTYGWAKLLGEIQCRSYYLDYGIDASVVRIFNAYGENESLDPKWSHVIPSLIRKAILYPREGYRIFGDGKQERAFLYVQDCVDGLITAMNKVKDAAPVNLGSDELISIQELAGKIAGLAGKYMDIEHDLAGPQGTRRYCADLTKMRKALNWSPRVHLEDGLSRTLEWARGELSVVG